MTEPMTDTTFDPAHGEAISLAPALRRIIAPNPSPMTWHGTNTYLLGIQQIAVIDPGPDSDAHLEAILRACSGPQTITHILVTHSHMDHSPLAARLSGVTGAPILAFGDSQSGRSAAMQACLDAGMTGGGEGIDTAFAPDVHIHDGQVMIAGDQEVTALHTPGHMGNHLSFLWNDSCFCGDLVMGWASSLVSPPDGDLTDFMASCRKLEQLQLAALHSGHGLPIEDPQARISWLIEHRQGREREILQALRSGPAPARALAEVIYTQTPAALIGAATRNVFAHLIDLKGKNIVSHRGSPSQDAVFELI